MKKDLKSVAIGSGLFIIVALIAVVLYGTWLDVSEISNSSTNNKNVGIVRGGQSNSNVTERGFEKVTVNTDGLIRNSNIGTVSESSREAEITSRRYVECVRQRTAFNVDTSDCMEWAKER